MENKPLPTHHVKVKEIADKSWRFLTSNGGTTRLRIHAAQFTKEKAEAMISENAPDNPGWMWKAVPI